MKKWSHLFLVTLLILSSMGAAQTALAETNTYVNPTDGYQIAYPAEWTMLDRSTIDDILQIAAEGKIPGLDVSSIQGFKEQMDSFDVAVFIVPGEAVITVEYTDLGSEAAIVDGDILKLIELLCPDTIQQYESALGNVDVIDAGSIAAFGEREFVTMSLTYELMNTPMSVNFYNYLSGTTLYVITVSYAVTGAAPKGLDTHLEDMLLSFVPA